MRFGLILVTLLLGSQAWAMVSTDVEPGLNMCGPTDFVAIASSECVRNFNLSRMNDQSSDEARDHYLRFQYNQVCDCLKSENSSLISSAVREISNNTDFNRILNVARADTCRRFEAVHGVVQQDLTFYFQGEESLEFHRRINVEARETSEQAAICHREEGDSDAAHENDVLEDTSTPQACIPPRNFRAFMKTPQYDALFEFVRMNPESQHPRNWNYDHIRRELIRLTGDVNMGGAGYSAIFDSDSNVLAGKSPEERNEIRRYAEQLRFLKYNPVFKYVMMLDSRAEGSSGVQALQTNMLTAFRNSLNSGMSRNCHTDGNPHSCKDSYFKNKSYEDLESAIKGAIDPSAFQEGELLGKILELNARDASQFKVNQEAAPQLNQILMDLPVDENLCQDSSFIASADSSVPNERCTRTLGLACGLVEQIGPSINRRRFSHPRTTPVIDALELSSESGDLSHFNTEICTKAHPPRNGRGAHKTYVDYEREICRQDPRCENGVAKPGERQNILAEFLEAYNTGNDDLRYFFRKTKIVYAPPGSSRFVSSGGRITDAIGNFNVDIPTGSSSSRAVARSAASSESASGSTTPSPLQDFSFNQNGQPQVPFIPSTAAITPSSDASSAFGEEPAELENARLERDQRQAAFDTKEADLARAREEGANQERLLQLQRELSDLRAAQVESNTRYQQLLQDYTRRSNERQVAQAPAASPSAPEATSGPAVSRAPAAASVAPVLAPRQITPDVPQSQNTGAISGGAGFSGAGVGGVGSAAALAGARSSGNYNAALSERYSTRESGGDVSLRVSSTSTGGSRLEVPVSGEVYGLVLRGNYDALGASVRDQLSRATGDGAVFIEVQSQTDSRESTELVALREGEEIKFYSLEEYQRRQARPAARAPASDRASLPDLVNLLGTEN